METKTHSSQTNLHEKVIEDYRLRLLAMRIELADAFKSKQVSKSYVSKKSERINKCLEVISQLSNIQKPSEPAKNSWLEKFALKTDQERQLAVQFCQRRIAEAKKTLLQIQSLSAICQRAKRNDFSIFRRTLTLSYLLRQFKKVEKSLSHIKEVASKVELKFSSLGMTPRNKNRWDAKQNLQEMIELVNKVDECSRRVVEKRGLTRSLKSKIEKMRTWLDHQQQLIRSSASSYRPPDPDEVQTIHQTLEHEGIPTLNKTRSRLTTARKLQSKIFDSRKDRPVDQAILLSEAKADSHLATGDNHAKF